MQADDGRDRAPTGSIRSAVTCASMSARAAPGFSLLEALLSIVLLGLMASVLSALYISGLQNIAVQAERAALDSALRSRMEEVIASDFAAVADDTRTLLIDGSTFTLTQTVANTDLSSGGGGTGAKTVTLVVVERPNLTLSTLLVDHEDRIGKI